jgi:hypothetical protein
MSSFLPDLLERAVKTYVQAFVVAFLLTMSATMVHGVEFSVAWWEAAAIAALGAALTAGASAVTSLFSKPIGDGDSASLLKPPPGSELIPVTLVSSETLSQPLSGSVSGPPGSLVAQPPQSGTSAQSSTTSAPPFDQPGPVDGASFPGYPVGPSDPPSREALAAETMGTPPAHS